MKPAASNETNANATDRSDFTPATDDRESSAAGALRTGERAVIAGVLTLIALLAGIDLTVDLREGVTRWHVATEGTVAAIACFGAFHLLRGAWRLRRRLDAQDRDFSAFRQQAEAWRAGSKKYLDGLSQSIGAQLDHWQLSAAEKEVAFLLLKGLSLKEIAAARRTSEKTARVQSSAVYTKSGLAGRSELSAFFLEDLLPPATEGHGGG
jgi:DNA-binding CsgD family transcriptional regulator